MVGVYHILSRLGSLVERRKLHQRGRGRGAPAANAFLGVLCAFYAILRVF